MNKLSTEKYPIRSMQEIEAFVQAMNTRKQLDWLALEARIDKMQNDFTKRLREHHPELTELDVHYVLLLRTNLTHNEIAHIMHIQISSFRMVRMRLKKKMKITADSFSRFIKDL